MSRLTGILVNPNCIGEVKVDLANFDVNLQGNVLFQIKRCFCMVDVVFACCNKICRVGEHKGRKLDKGSLVYCAGNGQLIGSMGLV